MGPNELFGGMVGHKFQMDLLKKSTAFTMGCRLSKIHIKLCSNYYFPLINYKYATLVLCISTPLIHNYKRVTYV